MSLQNRTIGLDRKIRLSWLDATANWVKQGASIEEIKIKLEELLTEVAGDTPDGARRKTRTVLLHIWAKVPKSLEPLRNEGLNFLQGHSGNLRLAIHWGMCMATYPFFSDLAITVGRLLDMQGMVSSQQIIRRMVEKWGERSTLIRSVQRTIWSMVEWEAIKESKERNSYIAASKISLEPYQDLGAWLIEACLAGGNSEIKTFQELLNSPMLFPFSIDLSIRNLEKNSRLEILHQNLNQDLIALKKYQKFE